MNNPSEPIQKSQPNFPSRLWGSLLRPHASVTEIGAQQQVQLLASLSLGYTLLLVISIGAPLIAHHTLTTASLSLLPILVSALIVYLLSRTPYYKVGAWLLTMAISISAYGQILGGADVGNTLSLNIGIALLIGSVVLSMTSMIILASGNVLVAIAFLYAIRPDLGATVIWQEVISIFALGGLILIILIFRNNIERQRLKELQNANTELMESRENLERRVAERTSELILATDGAKKRANQLEVIFELSTAIVQIQGTSELLPAVTRLISEHLGFYHVGIFLLDEKKEYAVLMAANSTGGQRMLQRSHRLRVGQVGIVGYVAERAEARISVDVGSDAVFFDNPDLPETHSEMALPLMIGNQLIGVMDVQSDKVSAFAQQDIAVMSTLANQVAVAIENARRFSETRQALAEARTVYSQYLRQAWQQVPVESNTIGYQYSNAIVKPISTTIDRPEIQSAIKSGQLVVQTEENPALAIPLKVRDEIIGVLNVFSKSSKRQWNENEMALVKAVTDRVALALENARLFEETTRRADRERTVSEITTHIRSASDPAQMLQTALDDLKRALGASEIQIRPYSPPPSGRKTGKLTSPEKK